MNIGWAFVNLIINYLDFKQVGSLLKYKDAASHFSKNIY